jgi:hypothetical protein
MAMGPHRRHVDLGEGDGVTAVLLVAGSADDDPAVVADAARTALRETDAVLTRRDLGVISILLRRLRDGNGDGHIVAERVHRTCEEAIAGPIRVGLAVATEQGEPLDLLLKRAEEALAAPAH